MAPVAVFFNLAQLPTTVMVDPAAMMMSVPADHETHDETHDHPTD
jgi:hypothetical protein